MANVSKSELINRVSEITSKSKKDTEVIINGLIDSIIDATSDGETVQIIGFGTFSKGHHNERTGHNPRTKEEIKIPASDYPKFKAGSKFKDACK